MVHEAVRDIQTKIWFYVQVNVAAARSGQGAIYCKVVGDVDEASVSYIDE